MVAASAAGPGGGLAGAVGPEEAPKESPSVGLGPWGVGRTRCRCAVCVRRVAATRSFLLPSANFLLLCRSLSLFTLGERVPDSVQLDSTHAGSCRLTPGNVKKIRSSRPLPTLDGTSR